MAIIAMLLAGCGGGAGKNPLSATHSEMKTIDSAPIQPAPIDPPPMLTDESPPPKQRGPLAQAPDAPSPPTPQDEAIRAALPFAPAIAMDPVSGSKISIRSSTLMLEYKNKIYYFSSEENKRTFASNPEQYTKGVFAHL